MTDCFFTYFVLQSIVCAGMIIWNFVKEKNYVGQILVFVLLYSSLYSTYLWTGKLDHEWKFRSDPLSITRSSQLFEVSQDKIKAFSRAVTPTKGGRLKAESCFPVYSISAWVWVVSSHVVLSLRVFGSHSQHSSPLEALKGQALEKVGHGAERSEA